MGFEPMIPITRDTRFPGAPVRPLQHLSWNKPGHLTGPLLSMVPLRPYWCQRRDWLVGAYLCMIALSQ